MVTFKNSIKALEQSTQILNKAWGLVWHLESVCNSEELRDAHNEVLPAVSEFGAKIPLDPKLWLTIKAFAESDESKNLIPIDQRLYEETLKDFEEAGANLPQDKKDRLEEISGELAKVTQKFSENVLDATNSWQMIVQEEEKLKGLPSSVKASAKQAAIEKLGKEKGS